MQIYRVAGYAKLAKLWERDPDRARSFHREFFEKKYAKPGRFVLTGTYIDITGCKEIRRRPEMLRLLKKCTEGRIDIIDMQTKGYLAANTREFCYMIRYLFDMEHTVHLVTEDQDYNINTLSSEDNQRDLLHEMASGYCALNPDDYDIWLQEIIYAMNTTETESNHAG